MITTPEQMREAAARDKDLIRRGDVTAIPMLGMTVTQIERAIRAIPIAPQPVAVTVKPSAARGAFGELARISLTAANCDAPKIGYYDYIAASALTIQPADPLSDPRVVALVEAAKWLGVMPEGYCFCSKDRIGDDSKVHEPECRDLRAALKEYHNGRF